MRQPGLFPPGTSAWMGSPAAPVGPGVPGRRLLGGAGMLPASLSGPGTGQGKMTVFSERELHLYTPVFSELYTRGQYRCLVLEMPSFPRGYS